MALGVQYSGIWTMAQQFQAVGAGTWKGIVNDELYAWGRNNFGALGDNTELPKSSPIQVGALTTWSKISGGGVSHSMALKTDGTMWLWGMGSYGRLGDNTVIYRSSPIQVGTLATWSLISAGYRTNIAAKTDGTMWTWGNNASGQIGDNTVVNKSSPIQVGALTTWSKIATGRDHGSAIKTDGTMWLWGAGQYGQLGDNTVIKRSSPVQIGALTTWSLNGGGSYHSTAIKTDGTMWTWGFNSNGQLGDNTVIYRSSPVQIGALTTWSKIAASTGAGVGAHNLAIKTDGTLWSFGYNSRGQLGDNTVIKRSSPIQVGALTTWSQIAVGRRHSMAIKTDGTMWLWGGSVNYGALGDNTVVYRSSPVQIGTLTTWTNIAAGGYHSLAISHEVT